MEQYKREDFFKEFQDALDLALFDKAPFDEELAVKSIATFYDEFELKTPSHYFVYEDAKALVANFDKWSDKVNGAVTSWGWSFPLVYPNSFWARFAIENPFNLTDKRKGPGFFIRNGKEFSAGINDLPKDILRSMWETLGNFDRLTEYTDLLEKEVDSIADNEELYDFLNGLLDVTSQENPFDVFFIGTDFKLVYEVAACNYLKNTHDIKRNDSYINSINGMLRYCGLVLGFDNVCVICKKVYYSKLGFATGK